MDITFPDQVIEYLRTRKGAKLSLDKQIARSEKQLNTLKPILDRYSVRTMIDIGCGLGLSSIMIAKYSNMNYLGLLDGDGTGELFHDFREDGKPWNDVKIAGVLAAANFSGRYDTFTPQQAADLFLPVDMVVSFKSWGTHYPIKTYLPFAARNVKPGGFVVVDLRPGDDEVFRQAQRAAVIAAGFELVQWGFEGDRRHVFRRV